MRTWSRSAPIAMAAALLLACLPASPAVDAGSGSDGTRDAGGGDTAIEDATSSGLPCTFNRDCPDSERCACDESTGCACERGPRGTGVSGVDPCVDGNDCASSLCVEGPASVYYCSGECEDAGDCGPMLPVCASIAYLGRVCVRQP